MVVDASDVGVGKMNENEIAEQRQVRVNVGDVGEDIFVFHYMGEHLSLR